MGTHGPMSTAQEHHVPLTALLAAVGANVGIAAAKMTAFVFTGSVAMLAESIHSIADTSNELLMLWGARRAQRLPDVSFPLGYSRERYFWSFIVAVLLFTVGGLYSIFEGTSKLRGPHEIGRPLWAFAVLTVAILLEAASLRVAVNAARPNVGSDGWWRFIRRTKSPELPVVILEDTGALVGLTLAVVGVGLTTITKNPAFDAISSIAIGCVLISVAWVLAREMKGLLIGESATPDVTTAIEAILTGFDEITEVIDLRTQHLGPDTLLVVGRLRFRPDVTGDRVSTLTDRVENRVRDRVPAARYVYFAPTGRPIGQAGTADT